MSEKRFLCFAWGVVTVGSVLAAAPAWAQSIQTDGNIETGGQLVSTVETGAPLAVSSTTMVPNLNADLVDGVEGTALALDAKNPMLRLGLAKYMIQAGDKVGSDYSFRTFVLHEEDERDTVEFHNDYPGFLVDGRKVSLSTATGCTPYGVPAGCRVEEVGRYRKTPFWLDGGKPLGLTCTIAQRGESCVGPAQSVTVQVGGTCDTQMRPVSGVR